MTEHERKQKGDEALERIYQQYGKALKAMANPEADICLCCPDYCKRCEQALDRGIALMNQEMEELRAELKIYKDAEQAQIDHYNFVLDLCENHPEPNEDLKKLLRSEPPWKT